MTSTQMRTKRIFDLLFLVLLAPLVVPICFILAVIIKLSAPKDPIFFTQMRVGKDGKLFKMFKFRSMVAGDHTSHTPVNADGSLKINADDKITQVGRLMRRLSLDELPQLINVILGDMSISGPRPEVSLELEKYDKETYKRLEVLPGLTGWAQVGGRNQIDFEQRHKLDIEYINDYSFLLDLKIVMLTISTIIIGNGIYEDSNIVNKKANIKAYKQQVRISSKKARKTNEKYNDSYHY